MPSIGGYDFRNKELSRVVGERRMISEVNDIILVLKYFLAGTISMETDKSFGSFFKKTLG